MSVHGKFSLNLRQSIRTGTIMDKPFSPACERNRDPILEILKQYITKEDRRLLEIGSGTGQHAVYFAPNFPQVEWHPSDVPGNIPGMKLWFNEAKIQNIQIPVKLEIGQHEFPKLKYDVVYTSNTFHIMHWKECKTFMKMLGNRLREGSRVFIYGPFKYEGSFTSPSNEQFDQELKARDPASGIRSFEDVNNAMIKNGFELINDFDMPANNQMLVYNRLKFIGK
jgi:cyclopropane fatty-acyl-phospholipid synthase-like methyltransferase